MRGLQANIVANKIIRPYQYAALALNQILRVYNLSFRFEIRNYAVLGDTIFSIAIWQELESLISSCIWLCLKFCVTQKWWYQKNQHKQTILPIKTHQRCKFSGEDFYWKVFTMSSFNKFSFLGSHCPLSTTKENLNHP